MGQFYSGSDLKRGTLQRCGEPTDGSSPYDSVVLKYLNQIYFNVIAGSNEFEVDCGEVWPWALSRTPIILTLQPALGSTALNGVGGGSVSVTSGSTAGAFSIAPTDSMKNQYLWVDDSNPERYRIVSHIAGATSFTLDGPYNGSTNAAGNFLVLRLVYPLGTEDQILRFVQPFRVYKMTFDEDRNYQVFGLDANSFRSHFPLASMVSGIPNRFTWFKNSDNQICAEFNQWVSETTRCEVDFIPPPSEITDSDDSIPIIPRPFRSALEYGATALVMFDKNDDRSGGYVQLTQQKLKSLIEATRKEQTHVNSKSKGVLFPRQEQLRVRQRMQSFIRQNN